MRVSRFLRGAAATFVRRPVKDEVDLAEHEVGEQPERRRRARGGWAIPADRDPDFHRKRARRRLARASRQYNRRKRAGKRARR